MNSENAYSIIYSFLITNQMIALGIIVVLVVLLWKKPKEFFKLLLFLFIVTVVFYILTLLNQSMDSSVAKKHEITTDREEHLFHSKEQVVPE